MRLYLTPVERAKTIQMARRTGVVIGSACLLVAASSILSILQFGSVYAGLGYLRGFPLAFERHVFEVAGMNEDDKQVVHCSFTNVSDKAIDVVGTEVTCGCVRLETGLPLTVGAKEMGQLVFTVGPFNNGAGIYEEMARIHVSAPSPEIILKFSAEAVVP